ncbi:hypothetical protein ACSSS7_000403 [Eimeria intestinalis]
MRPPASRRRAAPPLCSSRHAKGAALGWYELAAAEDRKAKAGEDAACKKLERRAEPSARTAASPTEPLRSRPGSCPAEHRRDTDKLLRCEFTSQPPAERGGLRLALTLLVSRLMETSAEKGLPSYSDAEDEETWMPFQRSAPDFVEEGKGWDRGGFLSPFQATPVEKIHAIIKAVQLTDKDYVFDLGCGDGRFIIECCRLTSCAGLGVDLDEGLIAKARANAAAAGNIRAEFHLGNFLDHAVDLLPATVIFVYLLPEALQLLAPRVQALIRTSPSLRCIVSLGWPLYALEASTVDRERRFFLYQREDLRRQTS